MRSGWGLGPAAPRLAESRGFGGPRPWPPVRPPAVAGSQPHPDDPGTISRGFGAYRGGFEHWGPWPPVRPSARPARNRPRTTPGSYHGGSGPYRGGLGTPGHRLKPLNHGTLAGLPVNSRTAQRFLPLRVQIRTVKHVTFAALDPGSSIELRFLVEKSTISLITFTKTRRDPRGTIPMGKSAISCIAPTKSRRGPRRR